jgi:hypothetical protein
MNNLCLIGNSHLGAIRLGASEIDPKLLQKFQLHFYGAPNDRLGTLYSNNNFLISDDAEANKYLKLTAGVNYIDILKYDHFVIHGFFGITPHLKNQSIRRFFSSAAYNTAFHGQFMNSTAKAMLKVIELIKLFNSNSKIYITPKPFDIYSGVYDSDGIYLEVIYNEFNEYFNKLKCEFIPQPTSTLQGPFGTNSIYSNDGCHLLGDIAGDGMHMNKFYGQLYLENILSLIK